MPRVRGVALLAVVCLCTALSAEAQQFGRNKVEYVDFEFRVLQSDHFSVYFYPSEEKAATIAARLAERWYARLSRLLDHELSSPQPLILYGSHPEFAQTNVVSGFLNEGIGGVTDSSRRRIVMPFAPTLEETDHVLGHEIVHAFQFDMTRKSGGALAWPLWAVEGMAEYLSLGRDNRDTTVWLKDAARSDLLPARQRDAARTFSPYRYGAALWTYVAGRFGDEVVRGVLEAPRGTFTTRLEAATGVTLEQLYAGWRDDARTRSASDAPLDRLRLGTPLLHATKGRMHLGPALSPDGRRAVIFSEHDRLSLDLFLVDVERGTVIRKLATTSGTKQYESLQAVRSSGSWSPDGARFVFAAVERGEPAFVVIDVDGSQPKRHITLPMFGQVLMPTWSPDGGRLAFTALKDGLTDLFIYDLARGSLRQLTDDVFADVQPAWSPDGRSIAFVTDRFTTDLDALRFGATELALVDLETGQVRAVDGFEGARATNPQWSAAGESLYFVSDRSGVSNVLRVDLANGELAQVTDVSGGVYGLTPTSPALSVARETSVIAFTSYQDGAYRVRIARGDAADGRAVEATAAVVHTAQEAGAESIPELERLLDDYRIGLPAPGALAVRDYLPRLSLETIGQPYLSSGGGPFGNFVRGGGSMLFGDLLGERRLGASMQIGNRLRDLAIGVGYLNRKHRWNWGLSTEVMPSLRRLPRRELVETDGEAAVSRQTRYFERVQGGVSGVLAYPLNQAQRFEFTNGVRHIRYRQTIQETVRSLETAKVLDKSVTTQSGGAPVTFGETTAAFVGDTAVFGPTSPIVGSRYRVEAASSFGDLSFSRLLIDYRRYVMPFKPFTFAGRVVHMGQFGPDAADPRILPAFLGSRQFVHGYGWNSLQCGPLSEGSCDAWEALLGNQIAAVNLEIRAPLLGLLSRELNYGSIPAEAFVFADSGFVWSRSVAFGTSAKPRWPISSAGAGIRLNGFGFPVEVAAVRAFDAPARGWSFAFAFQPGF